MTEIVSVRPGGRWSVWLRTTALWLALACYLVGVVWFSWNPTSVAQVLAAMLIASACLHATMAYGFRHMLAFFVICVSITFAVENLGVATGFPFGNYHFEVGANLPHIGTIPVIVGPLWFGMGYFSWKVASILLDGADRRLQQTINVIVLPIVAAFVMTQWDVVMDPPESTIAKAWIWHDGGANFGVPLSNYLGWLLTSWLFYQTFALYLRHQSGAWMQGGQQTLRVVAILFYVSAGLTHVTPWLMGQSGEAADATGHIWQIHELREATVAIMMFTMFFTALLSALRLAKDS